MKLGIMQPYFIPYLGYWQLMNIVDKYVIYDDVNYIKGGWINRNRILSNGNSVYLNLPLKKASPNKLINEIEVNLNEQNISKCLKTIKGCYSKAPFFIDVFPLMEKILSYDDNNLASFLKNSIEIIANYLNINTEFILSSDLKKNNNLRSENKVIHICKILNATQYYNAIGGRNLYDYETFRKENIDLLFINTKLSEYKQFDNDFVGGLSILDLLMFNSKDECIQQLNNFELLKEWI